MAKEQESFPVLFLSATQNVSFLIKKGNALFEISDYLSFRLQFVAMWAERW